MLADYPDLTEVEIQACIDGVECMVEMIYISTLGDPVGFNVKNEEAHRLAGELAELTGETLTGAVTMALRERLERVRKLTRRASADELLEIGRRCAAHIQGPISSLDHGDFLYDDLGLPK